MVFIISLLVYIICIVLSFKYIATNKHDDDILTTKGKIVAFTWFILFIISQIVVVNEVFNWIFF